MQAELKQTLQAKTDAECTVSQLELEIKKLKADLHVRHATQSICVCKFQLIVCRALYIVTHRVLYSFVFVFALQASCLQEEETSLRVDQLMALEKSHKAELQRLRAESENLQHKYDMHTTSSYSTYMYRHCTCTCTCMCLSLEEKNHGL